MRLLMVAANTFTELIRDKALLGLLAFAVIVIAISGAFGMISAGEEVKFIIDISLPAMLLFGVLISVLGGTNLVYREMERKTIYTLVSRPVRRWEFVVGKYVGIVMLLGVSIIGMSMFFLGYLYLFGGRPGVPLLQAIVMVFLEVMVVTAIALLMSTMTSPMLGAIVTFTLFVFGHWTEQLQVLSNEIGNRFLSLLFRAMYLLLPNLENFNVRAEAAHYISVAWARVGIAGLWGLAYSALAILLAAAVFEKRSF